MMKRSMTACLTLALALVLKPAVTAEETLLLLARHAEKQSESGNPDLTARGHQRAEALAEIERVRSLMEPVSRG